MSAVEAAALLGRHGAALFAALLLALLAATLGGWLLLQRVRPWLPRLERLPPGVYVGIWAVGGLALIAGAGAVFVEMAEAMDAEEELGAIDESFTGALRASIGPGWLLFFKGVTHLGDTATLVVLGVVVALWLLWRRHAPLAIGWSVALVGNGVLNPTLKRLFERVRPLHEHGLVREDGYSFPSGHSSGAVVAYGMLAYVLLRMLPARWHLAVLLLTPALVFSIGSSRVFLQVHYPSDVLAGFASGTAWVVVCLLGTEGLRQRRLRR